MGSFKNQAKPDISIPTMQDSIREKISKEQLVLHHMGEIGKFVLMPEATKTGYSMAVEHIEALMETLKDNEYKRTMARFTAETENLKMLAKRTMGRKARKRAFAEYDHQLHQCSYRELNKLADRVGIGWTKEGIADFEGYRKFLKDKGLPGKSQTEYAIKLAQTIHENIFTEKRNWLALFLGRVGSGKSYSACSLAKMFDPGFNLSRVVFDEDNFMQLVRAKLPPGSFIVADEIGSWLGSREYMTLSNRILSYVIQTFRNKRLGLIWTVPQRRQVDINLRSMSDVTFETVDIWREANRVLSKMKYTQINAMTGFEINPFPVLPVEEGTTTISRLLIPRPGRRFEAAYEVKKTKWQDAMYEHQHEELKGMNIKPTKKKEITKKELIIKALGEGKTVNEIAKQYDTASRYVREIKTVM